jgi:hypothetical protein
VRSQKTQPWALLAGVVADSFARAPSEARQTVQQQLVLIASALLTAGSVAALADVVAEVLAVPKEVALKVAKIAIVDVPEVSSRGFRGLLEEENLIYRAAYVRTAAQRLGVASLDQDGRFGASEALERHYFELHQAQELRREAGGEQVAEAMDLYGSVVGWYATIRPTNRPNHRQAHAQNFRPLFGPPVLTLAYPGVLPHCLCEVGPPLEGAPEIR